MRAALLAAALLLLPADAAGARVKELAQVQGVRERKPDLFLPPRNQAVNDEVRQKPATRRQRRHDED